MTRLHTEFCRLYHPDPAAAADAAPPQGMDAQGRVRALVLEVAAPADWEALKTVWAGVQTDLGWPAPAIAASGTDGLQLWFSLAEPLAAEAAHRLLDDLRQHYLPHLPARRLRLWPGADAEASLPHVPAQIDATGNWSAFVAPDLAPLFADTPWLDVVPGDDGQANLLCGLGSMSAAVLASAGPLLRPAPPAGNAPRQPPSPSLPPPEAGHTAGYHHLAAGPSEPARFLQSVMNDPAVPLALRIEAAKALLRLHQN